MRVLITGANRGIGRALLEQYQQLGAAAQGTSRGPGPLSLDVTDPEAVRRLAASMPEPLDLLICNAGIYAGRGDRLEAGFAAADWAQGFATNVTGVFLTVQAFLPQLTEAKGKIAIIGSRMGSDTRAPGGSYIYRASKAAVLNLGRNLAVDLHGRAIAVGIYHPGWVQTDMGGQEADISVATSAQGLVQQFAALDLQSSGCFLSYDGTELQF